MRAIVLRIRRFAWIVLILGLMIMVLPPLHVRAQSSTLTELRFQGGEVQVGEAIELDLMLVRSVEGIQRFDLTISIENPSIARMQGVSGGVISGAFFQVASQTEESVRFRAVDLEGLIEPGAENLVLAEITLVGVKEGTTGFDIEIGLLISDRDAQQEAAIEGGPSQLVQSLFPKWLQQYPKKTLHLKWLQRHPKKTLPPKSTPNNPPGTSMETGHGKTSMAMVCSRRRILLCSPILWIVNKEMMWCMTLIWMARWTLMML